MTVSARFAAYDNQGEVEVQGLDWIGLGSLAGHIGPVRGLVKR
jgi:hypothetical protein